MHAPATRRLRAFFAIGPVVCLSWLGAHAAFTDSVDATTEFSTGNVEIRANGQTGAVAFTSLSMANLTPGTVRYAPLTITNSGSSDFVYTLATAVTQTGSLADALSIGINAIDGTDCSTAADFDGAPTSLHPVAVGLGSAAFAARPLASGVSEVLCFRVELPAGAGNGLQGQSATATFTFTATA